MLIQSRKFRIFSLFLALVLTQTLPALAAAGNLTRISVSSSGAEGDEHSYSSSISADGRYVAFYSKANNLVSGDTNEMDDVFVRDTVANTTQRISVSSSGVEGNYDSSQPSISADGRYVAFVSGADNLVSGDTNIDEDIFVRDIVANTTKRVSVSSSGAEGNDYSLAPSISADGRYVVFESGANNLVSGDTNGWGVMDIFVRDTMLNTTKRVSVSSSGVEGNDQSFDPSISADGRYVAFVSRASNLVSGDTNESNDIFVYDMAANTTTRVSISSSGAEAETTGEFGWTGSTSPFISADGRYVVFSSVAYNLVNGDTNGFTDIFVRDIVMNTTTCISLSLGGLVGNSVSISGDLSISADGRYVAFMSRSSDLVSGDTNELDDVFVRDTQANTTTRISVASSGVEGDNNSSGASISADGRYVAFGSFASNLVSGDTNAKHDVFLYTVGGGTTFTDVPTSYWAWQYIERLYNAGITGGCSASPLMYCPESTVTRAQMAIFILRGIHGNAYTPPAATGTVFTDVPLGSFAADWIEQLAFEGVTAGCGGGNYCPEATITRAQMAIFLLRGEHGNAYTPPAATGTVFGDVPLGSFADAWIEQLAAEGITSGCGGGNYCPNANVTRAEMAVFLVRAFGLP
ncbi:S-layer homology domain-containing protein [Candidatus Villigracilis affinis]|uniref:S-layer homology domain-containing protein n=1 Tax=Candidatus Villigracilis affinis TaxID=3140682 RepID=UPI002A1D352C|nr:PD40 domain-containing protein [Anaerolineales bacterium]